MSARQRLIDAITGDDDLCYCNSSLCSNGEELIDDFAHELAEKIREKCSCGLSKHCVCTAELGAAADLIDPEVN
jgi:hypothetical protein